MASSTPLEGVESHLLLGSNLGDRLRYLNQGVNYLAGLPDVRVLKRSSVYETDPVGYVEQPNFLNVAATISTTVEAHKLLYMLKDIEIKLGRVHRDRWKEREIDIDIIFYGDSEIDSADLTIPHPRAHMRRFVLQPLSEIVPNFIHPVLKKTVKQLLEKCEDNSSVRKLEEQSAQIGS